MQRPRSDLTKWNHGIPIPRPRLSAYTPTACGSQADSEWLRRVQEKAHPLLAREAGVVRTYPHRRPGRCRTRAKRPKEADTRIPSTTCLVRGTECQYPEGSAAVSTVSGHLTVSRSPTLATSSLGSGGSHATTTGGLAGTPSPWLALAAPPVGPFNSLPVDMPFRSYEMLQHCKLKERDIQQLLFFCIGCVVCIRHLQTEP